MLKKIITSLVLLIFLLAGCDTEKFVGYNYDARQFTQTATISGRVINRFDNQTVPRAKIEIDDRTTFTDNQGNYQLEYILSDDAEANREIALTASAVNFFPQTKTRVIFPEDTEINFELEYGAPIIEETACFEMRVCQVILVDYQGIDDVESVTGHFRYLDENTLVTTYEFDVQLELKKIVSENRAHYQKFMERTSPVYGVLSPTYTITARDKSGFSKTVEHTNNDRDPDPLLFEPDWP